MLNSLLIGNNALTGVDPSWAIEGGPSSLVFLDLSYNQIGVAADETWTLPQLTTLDLSGNPTRRVPVDFSAETGLPLLQLLRLEFTNVNLLAQVVTRLVTADATVLRSTDSFAEAYTCSGFSASHSTRFSSLSRFTITVSPQATDFVACACNPGFFRASEASPCVRCGPQCGCQASNISRCFPASTGAIIPCPLLPDGSNACAGLTEFPPEANDQTLALWCMEVRFIGLLLIALTSCLLSVCVIQGHTGRLCASCLDGYFSDGRRCLSCPAPGIVRLRIDLVSESLWAFVFCSGAVDDDFGVSGSVCGLGGGAVFGLGAAARRHARHLAVILHSGRGSPLLSFVWLILWMFD